MVCAGNISCSRDLGLQAKLSSFCVGVLMLAWIQGVHASFIIGCSSGTQPRSFMICTCDCDCRVEGLLLQTVDIQSHILEQMVRPQVQQPELPLHAKYIAPIYHKI